MKKSKKRKLSITIDLEDYRKDKSIITQRYEKNTLDILDWLENRNIKATFFTVGQIAEQSPILIKKINDSGHEIGYHSYDHKPLTKINKNKFFSETKKNKSYIEDLIGKKLIGYRAPYFSLTPKTKWVLDLLLELDFEYSSSTIPKKIKNNFGYPGIPESPFKWSNGLLELPMVLSNFMGVKFPSIGGLYLRYIPMWFIQKTLLINGLRWTYIHPQDIDFDEPFTRVDHFTLLESFFCHFRKRNTFKQLDKLIKNHNISCLSDDIYKLNLKELPIFEN